MRRWTGLAGVAAVAAATVIGAWALWPDDETTNATGTAFGRELSILETDLIVRDAREADAVVRGRVLEFGQARVIALGDNESVFTPVRIEVEETLAGAPVGDDVVVVVPGGYVNGRGQAPGYGQEDLGAGQEVVFFLVRAKPDDPRAAVADWERLRAYHVDGASGHVVHQYSPYGAPVDEFVALVRRSFEE